MKMPNTRASQATTVARAVTGRTTRSQTRFNPLEAPTERASTSRVRNVASRGTGRLGRPRKQPTSNQPLAEIPTPETTASSQEETVAPSSPTESSVPIVDLATPSISITRVRRPVEVDLTCELDDEVYVLLEDIINPSRRPAASNPVMLGSSPPRTRRNIISPRRTVDLNKDVSTPRLNINPLQGTSLEVPSSSSSEIQCPICLDTLSQMKALQHQPHSTVCGHLFCRPCITRAISDTKQCPTCRQALDLRKIHPIFI